MTQRIMYVKIIGERNTGTNFVEDIIEKNFKIGVFPGDLPDFFRVLYNAAYKYLPHSVARAIVEGDRNRRYDSRFHLQAGWKHARMPNLPKGHDRYPEGLGFIAITKNPYAWLQSLHRRPYQGVHHRAARPLSFSEFLRTPWPTVGREYAPPVYGNPVQMWNDKVRSYEVLYNYGPTLVLPYEKIIEDTGGFVHEVSLAFNLPNPNRVDFPTVSTKKDGRTTDSIVQHYLSGKWAETLSEEDVRFINQELDHDIREKFGYGLITKHPQTERRLSC